jgi:hypothetical protein
MIKLEDMLNEDCGCNGPQLIKEVKDLTLSEGLQYHIREGKMLTHNVYRPLSENYFNLFREARELYEAGLLSVTEEDAELLESNIGEYSFYNGIKVPLDYPISHHLDVEIHWIHTKSKELIFKNGVYHFRDLSDRTPLEDYKNKWERRSQRAKNKEKIFLWSASEMFNIHGNWKRKQLIDRFKSLSHRSIFLTERPEEEFEDENHIVKFIPEWRDNNQFQRDSSGGILWNNQEDNSEIMYNIIQEKFLK